MSGLACCTPPVSLTTAPSVVLACPCAFGQDLSVLVSCQDFFADDLLCLSVVFCQSLMFAMICSRSLLSSVPLSASAPAARSVSTPVSSSDSFCRCLRPLFSFHAPSPILDITCEPPFPVFMSRMMCLIGANFGSPMILVCCPFT